MFRRSGRILGLACIVGIADDSEMDVQALIAKAGGTVALAGMLGVARTTVLDWRRTGLIPGNRIGQISAALDIPVDDLLPLVQLRRPSSEGARQDGNDPVECAA